MEFRLSEEQRLFRQAVRAFAEQELKPRACHVDETGEFNWEAVRKGASLGLLGLTVPEAYGGAGLDHVSAAIALEEVARGCGSTALSLAAHNGLGLAPILLFGTEAQKRRWLPAGRRSASSRCERCWKKIRATSKCCTHWGACIIR